MDEPTRLAPDGTPWVEPRGPHLPDWLTSRAGRIPGRAWVFIVVALIDAFWQLRAIPTSSGGFPTDPIPYLVRAVPGVATCLIGAALFTRHRQAWSSDRLLVFGAVLFVVVEVLDRANDVLRSSGVLFTWFPDDPFGGQFTAPALALDAMGGIVTVFAILYLARGVLAGRVGEVWEASPWSTVPIWVVGVLGAAFGLASYALAVVQGDISELGVAYAVYLVILIVSATLIVVGWAYLATIAATGSVNGEGPPNAWAIAAMGGLAIVVGYLISSIATVAGWIAFSPTSEATWTLTLASGAVIIRAVGFVLLLAGFALGLPAAEDEEAV